MGGNRRSTARKLAMQMLYQYQVGVDDISAQSDLYLITSRSEKQTQGMAKDLAIGAWGYCKQSDASIKLHSLNWEVDRITMVDHAIMRLAIYEINCLDTPNVVAVDEAIELAKRFSTHESAKFINGVLGAYIKALDPDHV